MGGGQPNSSNDIGPKSPSKVKNIEHSGAGKCRIERDEAESLGMVLGADRSSRMKLDQNWKTWASLHLECPATDRYCLS